MERDNEGDDAPRRRAVPFDGHGPSGRWPGDGLYRAGTYPKITIDQARAIALKARPGRITDEELEREDGGSGLRYTFSVEAGPATQELGVDAATSQVLENSPD
jgi:uncharacterized membrane protein YkoI